MSSKTFRPEDLASELGVSGKQIRGFLRATFTRPATAKGSTWVVTSEQAKKVRAHFLSRRATTPKPVTRKATSHAKTTTGVKVTSRKPTVKAGTRAKVTAPLPNPADTGMNANA